ncbi:MAG: hypothetical protein ACK52I_15705, partial [Pseudomonadota bacterium]
MQTIPAPATPDGVEFAAPAVPGQDEILTPAAVTFVAELARRFGPRVEELL